MGVKSAPSATGDTAGPDAVCSPMPTIAWNPAHDLHQPVMDRTHHEFVDRLGALEEAVVGAADDTDQVLDELIRHTESHFAQEEQWMQQLGFADENCHSMQHRSVLEVMREAARRHRAQADLQLLGVLVQALDEWFAIHAPSQDAGLAAVMAEQGFDPATGERRVAALAGAAPISGCGSAGCGV
jgi:hemerythrin